MLILYTTRATATGGRAGRAVTEDGVLDVTLTVPKEMGGGYGIEVALSVHIPGVERAVAERLAAAAHIVCPYSHAMRTQNKVPVTVV